MSTGRRYTAEEMERMSRTLHYTGTDEFSDEAAQMLSQAAIAEAQVMGLVEAVEELLPIAISSESNGPVERDRIREAREALSKFRGES